MVRGSTYSMYIQWDQVFIFGEDEGDVDLPRVRYDSVQARRSFSPPPLANEWAVEVFWNAACFPGQQPCETDMSDRR